MPTGCVLEDSSPNNCNNGDTVCWDGPKIDHCVPHIEVLTDNGFFGQHKISIFFTTGDDSGENSITDDDEDKDKDGTA